MNILTLLLTVLPLWAAGFNTSLADCPSTATGHCSNVGKGNPFPENLSLVHGADSMVMPVDAWAQRNVSELVLPIGLKRIVIDAGHGGHDPGCSGSDSHEKNITLALAKAFAAELRAAYPSLEVILTRDSDVFVPLHERAAIANRAHADLFVSIHCNAMPASSATWGSETYVMGLHTADHNLNVAKRENDVILMESDYERHYDYDPNSPEGHILLSMFQNVHLEQSIRFAERVEHHFVATAGRRSRGVKQAGFVVLKETTMPSVLIEAGFLTNSSDEAFLDTTEGQAQVAKALLAAFADYTAQIGATPDAIANAPARPPKATPTPTASAPGATQGSRTPSVPVVQTPSPPPPATAQQSVANNARPTATPQQATVKPEPTPPMIIPTQSATPQALPAPGRASQPQASANTNSMLYCVQIAAASQPVNTKTPLWQNSGHLIEVLQEDNLYKYQVRNLKNLDDAFAARLQLQQKGFPDAFIVVYRNGRRISLEEARQLD